MNNRQSFVYFTIGTIAGGFGAFASGTASNATGQCLNYVVDKSENSELKFKFNWLSLLISAGASVGTYYASSAAGWAIDRNKIIPSHTVSFRQYVTMQADFQRSRFWHKEYGGYLLDNGKVDRMPLKNRSSSAIIFTEPRPNNAFAEYHTHWDVPGIINAVDASGNYIEPSGISNGIKTSQYHGIDDFGHGLPSVVINRYDASYHYGASNTFTPPNQNYTPINPFFIRSWSLYYY
ncbi:MAG: hypothetical protein LBV69_05860 [Bacteroidales bacterium]|jgi:hypothetical protein|nr:hypothetical protein [Bacteroidales bacterium]